MSGYIGSNNIDIATNFTSSSKLTEDNTWDYSAQFFQLSTPCIDISSASYAITDIPNNIIISGGDITITFPSTMLTAIIIHIRRTISGTTTFSGPTFYTTSNGIMTSSTDINLSFISYNNAWYKLF